MELDHLIEQLRAPDLEARKAAGAELLRMRVKKQAERKELSAAIAQIDAETVAAYLADWPQTPWFDMKSPAYRICHLFDSNPHVEPELRKALESGDEELRKRAATALALEFRDVGVLDLLLGYLEQDAYQERTPYLETARALGQIPDRRVLDVLKAHLQHYVDEAEATGKKNYSVMVSLATDVQHCAKALGDDESVKWAEQIAQQCYFETMPPR